MMDQRLLVATERRARLGEIEPWLLDIARELTAVVRSADHFGTAEWIGAGKVVQVERTANGIGASFWQVIWDTKPATGQVNPLREEGSSHVV